MKKQLPIEMTNNGIHYTLHGDYYFPDIELPEASHQTIGHYGRMRKAYLEEHRPGLYTRLLLSGKLYDHLTEINACCSNRMERMIRQMAEAEGINEDLKARDQLAWVGRMKVLFGTCSYDLRKASLVYGYCRMTVLPTGTEQAYATLCIRCCLRRRFQR